MARFKKDNFENREFLQKVDFEEFINNNKNININYKQYKKIIDLFFTKIADQLLIDPLGVVLPNKLGKLIIKYFYPKKPAIDWGKTYKLNNIVPRDKTKKIEKLYYIDYNKFGGIAFRLLHVKREFNSTYMSIPDNSYWSFRPSNSFARKMGKMLKTLEYNIFSENSIIRKKWITQ